jgi:ATP-dependent protease HslVU (ClpYQ) peptidase subunit
VTTIVGVQGPGWAIVGSDSRVTEEYRRVYTIARGGSKVMKNRKYLLGAAGDMRALNIIAYSFKPPDPLTHVDSRLDRFITSEFVPALRDCFERQGYSQHRTDSGPAESGAQVICIVNGAIYIIGEDYSWVRDVAGLYGIGSGGDYAAGVLHALLPDGTKDITKAKAAVKSALTVASKLDSGTGPPFNLMLQNRPPGAGRRLTKI